MRHKQSFCWYKLVGWSLILYLFVFQPIISKFIYLGVEFLVVLFFYIYKRKIFKDNSRLFKREYVFAGLMCGYAFMIDMFHFEIVFLDRFLASFFQGYACALILIYCISKSSFLQDNLANCLVCMCFIACSITLAAILIPSVALFCNNNATLDAKERLQELYVDGGFTQFRMYGLSESLSFTYSYVLSVIGCYLLSNKFKIYTPFLLIMILVAIMFNARIAFIPLLVALLYLLFLKKKSVNGTVSLVVTILTFSLLVMWGLSAFPQLNSEWGLSFFTELSSLLSGKESETIDTLTGSMWVIPDNNIFDLVFGTGENLFVNKRHSDVGYILQLNYGGVILLSMVLLYFVYISKRIARKLTLHHWFPIIFIISIFILNFKGFYLAAIPGNRFLTFLYVYFIYASRKGIYELSPKQKLI